MLISNTSHFIVDTNNRSIPLLMMYRLNNLRTTNLVYTFSFLISQWRRGSLLFKPVFVVQQIHSLNTLHRAKALSEPFSLSLKDVEHDGQFESVPCVLGSPSVPQAAA